MGRRGDNIYKRKDGRWEGRYIKDHTVAGKAIYGYIYAPSYREAKEKLNAARLELSLNQKKKDLNEDITIGELAERWLELIQPTIKESSYHKYKNLIYSYIDPEFHDLPCSKLTNTMLEQFSVYLLTNGGKCGNGLSGKTLSDIISVMRRMLSYAKENGFDVITTADNIRIKNKNEKELRILTPFEQKKLSEYLLYNINDVNLGILLCLFTGLRIGEICALRWEDISLQEKIVSVKHTLQRVQTLTEDGAKTKIILSTPKSLCSIRTIPLPDDIVFLLKRHEKDGYILTGTEYKFMEPRTMDNHFKRVIKQCGIERINFHALRHTFATRCVELGFDLKSLSEILGHSNVNITLNRYVHPSIELKRQNMQRLSKLITVK